jgi:hypothetical protein
VVLILELREEVPLEEPLDLGLALARNAFEVLEDSDEGHCGLGAEKVECPVALLVDGASVFIRINLQFTFIRSFTAHQHEDDVRNLTDVQDRVNIMAVNDPEDNPLLLRAHVVVGACVWANVRAEL